MWESWHHQEKGHHEPFYFVAWRLFVVVCLKLSWSVEGPWRIVWGWCGVMELMMMVAFVLGCCGGVGKKRRKGGWQTVVVAAAAAARQQRRGSVGPAP